MENTALIEADDPEIMAYLALPRRDQIASLTADMLADSDTSTEFDVKHSFAPGIYMREMFIPKGTLVVGKIHKVECANICALGCIDIFTELGSMTVTAGFTAVSAPGTQKLGYAHEDTVWINVFNTDETDIEKLEAMLVYTDAEAIKLLDPEGKYFKVKELECLQDGSKPALQP